MQSRPIASSERMTTRRRPKVRPDLRQVDTFFTAVAKIHLACRTNAYIVVHAAWLPRPDAEVALRVISRLGPHLLTADGASCLDELCFQHTRRLLDRVRRIASIGSCDTREMAMLRTV